jgi:hypothetical protein
MKDLINKENNESFNEFYERFIQECRSIIVTKVSLSRMELIEGYHMLGKEILENHDRFEREKIYGEKIVQRIANSLNMSTRLVYYIMKFVEKYPDLDFLPDGVNVSWHKLVKNYLSDKVVIKEECKHEEYVLVKICKACKKQIRINTDEQMAEKSAQSTHPSVGVLS